MRTCPVCCLQSELHPDCIKSPALSAWNTACRHLPDAAQVEASKHELGRLPLVDRMEERRKASLASLQAACSRQNEPHAVRLDHNGRRRLQERRAKHSPLLTVADYHLTLLRHPVPDVSPTTPLRTRASSSVCTIPIGSHTCMQLTPTHGISTRRAKEAGDSSAFAKTRSCQTIFGR